MFVHGVVGLLEEAVAVNLFLEVFFSHFVLLVLLIFKGKLCRNFHSP